MIGFVSDHMKYKHLEWKKGDRIIISSQTGSGKTPYVFKTLLPDAVNENKFLVYYCNRRAIKDQLDQNLDKILKNYGFDESSIAKLKSKLDVRTYQDAEYHHETDSKAKFPTTETIDGGKIYEYKRKEYGSSDVKYFIFDEAHYFISDAVFNQNTNKWETFLKRYDNAICVYLTATPEPLNVALNIGTIDFDNDKMKIFEAITTPLKDIYGVNLKTRQIEYRYSGIPERKAAVDEAYGKLYDNMQYYLNLSKKDLLHYHEIPSSYDYIDTFYYENDQSLISQIKESHEDEKWMIFVDNKKVGEALYYELAALIGKKRIDGTISNIAYIDSSIRHSKKYNASAAYKQIQNNNKFDYRVLICTAVLDCGINIIDPKVKNIVISNCDKTSFLQMLGRVRRIEGNNLNLYIKNKTRQTVSMLLVDIKNKINSQSRIAAADMKSREIIDDPDDWTLAYEIIQFVFMDSKRKKAYSVLNHKSFNDLEVSLHPVPDGKNRQGQQKFSLVIETNPMVWLHDLYSFFEYQSAILQWKKSNDSDFFLKTELGWIGQTYDSSHWLDDIQAKKELTKYLMEVTGKTYERNEQKVFSEKCVEIMLKFYHKPSVIKKNLSTYVKMNTYPQNNALNKAFQELGFDFHIDIVTFGSKKTKFWLFSETV